MTVRILIGDCRSRLRELPDDSVHCIVTSPPYFGLRDYGTPGQIGLEPVPADYVAEMVALFRDLRRVLRPDGTCWLNLGDSYAGSWGAQARGDDYPGGLEGGATLSARSIAAHPKGGSGTGSARRFPGLKPKDLIGIPWRVAFAIQEDGWWLRGDQVWAKANGMPESTRDRPTRAHEFVFLLTKSDAYYYGYDDVKMPSVPESVERLERAMRSRLDQGDSPLVLSGAGYAPPGQPPHQSARKSDKQRGHTRRHAGFNDRWDDLPRAEQQARGAALRSVWWIAPSTFDGAHFAVMPSALAATCISAGCPAGGTVLDPFGGAGTTALVADRLGRDAIMIELNPEYAEMARQRILADGGMLTTVEMAA